MKRLLAVLLLLILPACAHAQAGGPFVRTLCTGLTAPTVNTVCFDTTARYWKVYNGSAWVIASPTDFALDYNTVVTISGQANLINTYVTPTATGTDQQLGFFIDMATTNAMGGGSNYRIPMGCRIQTGGGTGPLTGEGMRCFNGIVQWNAADTNATGWFFEANLNNNKVDDGAAPLAAITKGGIAINSTGAQPIWAAYYAAGTGQFYNGLKLAQGSIKSTGNAVDYLGDGTNGIFRVAADGRVTIGNAGSPFQTFPSIQVSNGIRSQISGMAFGGTAFTAGSFYKDSGQGFTIGLITGSVYDMDIVDPSNTLHILRVPTGTNNILFPSLTTTGAAAGKKVVCVDVATGQLYASTSGTDCAS